MWGSSGEARSRQLPLFWTIGGQIVAERTSWCRLCAQMMTLLHVLGMDDQSSAQMRLRPWPDCDLLQAAAARARGMLGRFARADTSMPLPSVRALISHHRYRAPSTSMAQQGQRQLGRSRAGAPRRAARKDAEAPSHPPRRAAVPDSNTG
jgi:hypothetical protein